MQAGLLKSVSECIAEVLLRLTPYCEPLADFIIIIMMDRERHMSD